MTGTSPLINRDFFREAGRSGGQKSSAMKFRSLVTGAVSTKTGITRIHQRLGVDPLLREPVDPQVYQQNGFT
jgi:general stress protein YciG